MSSSELIISVLTLLLTICGWFVTLIVQLIVLYRQSKSQVELTKLQNELGARREIAPTRLNDLNSIRKWLDEGWAFQEKILPLEIFLSDDDMPDPRLNIREIAKNLRVWANGLSKLQPLAEIYDPKFRNAKKWAEDLSKKIPEDLPQLLLAFRFAVYNYVWEQFEDYQNRNEPVLHGESIVRNTAKYLPVLYKNALLALERVREFVVTDSL